MTHEFREHVCPNCGAPLGIPEKHERFFKCQFCGTVLEDHASPQEQETGVFKIKISQDQVAAARAERIPVYTAPPGRAAEPTAPQKSSSSRLGCVIGVAIFLLVGGILAVSLVPALFAGGVVSQVLDQSGLEQIAEGVGLEPVGEDSGLGGLQIYSFGPVAMLPSDNDTSPDVVGVARGADDRQYLLYIDFESEPALRWQVEVEGEDATFAYNRFLSDGSRLYFSYGDQVAAYNREQGALIWEATLSDKIQHNICPGCFQQFDQSILTLTADGSLTARDAAGGDVAWQVRLTETPRQIVPFGGNPAVLDDIDGQVGLKVFNLSDGSLVQQLLPACPNEPFPSDPQEVGIYSHMLPIPQGDGVVFFGGFFEPGCAIYWQPGQEEYTWLTTFDPDVVSNIGPENITLTNDALYIGKDHGAYAIDLASGTFTTLLQDEDYNVYPIAARDGVLALRMERARGTRQLEIWGVDAGLGNVKWTFLPEAASFFDYPSHPLDESGAWVAGLTSDGLTVAQLYDAPSRALFQTIPLQSGTASEPVTYNFQNTSGSLWTAVLGWRNRTFWVLGDTTIYVIDVGTGETDSRWH